MGRGLGQRHEAGAAASFYMQAQEVGQQHIALAAAIHNADQLLPLARQGKKRR